MADENYVDLYKDEETGKVGTIIAGKDVVRLNAPEVLLSPDTPLLTNAQDLAGAINELFQSGGEGGDGQDVYTVNGSGSSITVQTVSGRSSGSPAIKTYNFSFTTKEFKKSTTITGSNKVITKTWTKNIITSISNSSGEIIFTMDADTSGKVTACYDRSGNEILNGATYGDSVFTSTPEGVALGWALAYCKEQDEETERAKQAYEDGRKDNIDAGGDGETKLDEVNFEGGELVVLNYIDYSLSSKAWNDGTVSAYAVFNQDYTSISYHGITDIISYYSFSPYEYHQHFDPPTGAIGIRQNNEPNRYYRLIYGPIYNPDGTLYGNFLKW